ncbi:MAG: ferrous iron transport protein A [Sulfurovum sp.]|nr:MAG: ferrous iron transport protein A [Sulfurovum sp.]
MHLMDLKKGDKAMIVNIDTKNQALKKRLYSFGVMPGEELSIKRCSLRRRTMEIKIDTTLIALRAEEASIIQVKPII